MGKKLLQGKIVFILWSRLFCFVQLLWPARMFIGLASHTCTATMGPPGAEVLTAAFTQSKICSLRRLPLLHDR